MKQDAFYAKWAFYLGLFFWFPLFNIPLCVASLFLSLKALRLHHADPKRYGGRNYAMLGLVFSVIGIVLTIVGLAFYIFRGRICGSAICSSFLATK
ncbi:MAG: hypothetical protein V1735_06995 [Nanoarchaeota archaeon]